MTTFDHSLHPRGSGGKFATKQHAEPAELAYDVPTDASISEADDTAVYVQRHYVNTAVRAVEAVLRRQRQAEFRSAVAQTYPSAAFLSFHEGDDGPELDAYLDRDGKRVVLDHTDSGYDDVSAAFRTAHRTGSINGAIYGAVAGSASVVDLGRLHDREQSPEAMFDAMQAALRNNQGSAESGAMSRRVRARIPEAKSVHVYAVWDNHDEVSPDDIELEDGTVIAVTDLKDRYGDRGAQAGLIIEAAFARHAPGRDWATWFRDGIPEDDRQPAIVHLDDLY